MLTLFVVLCTCAAVYFSILICIKNEKKSVSPTVNRQTVTEQVSPSSQPKTEQVKQATEATVQSKDEQSKQLTASGQDTKLARNRSSKLQKSKTPRKKNMMDLKAILSNATSATDESAAAAAENATHQKQGTVKPDNHDYDYPVSENMEMWAAKPLPLSDLMHLKNFVNYLLRTDQNQKWTNEFTPLCYMAFSRNTEKIYTMGELSNRILSRDILLKDAMKGISGKTVDHLCMQMIELHALNGEDMPITDEQRIALFQDFIRRRELCKDGWNVLAYIEHSDGNDRPYHIHTLCRKEIKKQSEQ